MNLTTRRLTEPGDPLFAELWQLYESSFPWEERHDAAWQQRAMSDDAFRCMRVEQDGQAVALLFYWERPGYVYLEHLAVHPSRRGQGLGTVVLDLLPPLPVVLEIEPVCDDATARRLRFYEHAGYRLLPCKHTQPPYHPGLPPLPLSLLVRGDFSAEMLEDFRAWQPSIGVGADTF